jgi:hypothetical protein
MGDMSLNRMRARARFYKNRESETEETKGNGFNHLLTTNYHHYPNETGIREGTKAKRHQTMRETLRFYIHVTVLPYMER